MERLLAFFFGFCTAVRKNSALVTVYGGQSRGECLVRSFPGVLMRGLDSADYSKSALSLGERGHKVGFVNWSVDKQWWYLIWR